MQARVYIISSDFDHATQSNHITSVAAFLASFIKLPYKASGKLRLNCSLGRGRYMAYFDDISCLKIEF